MARRSRRLDSTRSSTESSSDEEAIEVRISSPTRSSKKRRSRRSSRYSKELSSDDEAHDAVRDGPRSSKNRRSHRSSRNLMGPSSAEKGRNLELRASTRRSQKRRSQSSRLYSTEILSDEEQKQDVLRIIASRQSQRISKGLVEISSCEEVDEVVTTSSKTHHSRSSSTKKRKEHCRLMVGTCFCTVGIFLAVITVILILQRNNRIHDGIPLAPPSTPLQDDSASRSKLPTPSPTSHLTISPAPSTTIEPSKSPSFRPSKSPTLSPSTLPSDAPTTKPSPSPTDSPSWKPTSKPTATFRPTRAPTPPLYPRKIVLQSEQFLQRGDFVSSPSGEYRVGLSLTGEFVLLDSTNKEVWKPNASGAQDLFLQDDGNLVMRDASQSSLWSTKTSTSSASLFMIDDGGIIGLIQTFRTSTESTYVWMKGVPRGRYTGAPVGSQISYPVRAAFYYPWFPETWTVGGKRARFAPDVGWYHSGDPSVVHKHIEQMEYGRIDLGVAAWFGIDTNNDIARITQLLEKTEASNSRLKWALYYEMFEAVRTVEEIRRDLDYIKRWYAWHPSYAHINGKPVIFIYQSRGCDTIKNWVDASQGEWYLVPKIFIGYGGCTAKLNPGKYHQYAPANPVKQYDGLAFTISPGFWKANETEPRLARLDQSTWCQNVQRMVDSKAPWQLITTFNEAGEGTIIEPSRAHWPSASGYGIYLDCLHNIY